MTECFNTACPYCMDYQCGRTCTCDMRLDGEYVKVVRCKDCRHNYANMIPGGRGCQRNVYIEVDDNFFCADGARMDEVEE